MADGATAFDGGDLDDAIAAWQAPMASGWEVSGVARYDLGVAWYRKGDMPRHRRLPRGGPAARPRDFLTTAWRSRAPACPTPPSPSPPTPGRGW
ncbi:MAG: hypothetical protein R3F59_26540 [Myxococcota bacterium]